MIKRASYTVVILFLGSIIGFVSNMVLAKLFGATEYGRYNTIIAYATSIVLFTNFGLKFAVLNNITIETTNNISRFLNFLLFSVAITTPISGIVLFFLFKFNLETTVFIILITFLNQVSALSQNFYIAIKKPEISQLYFNLLPKVFFFTISIALGIAFSKSSEMLVIAFIISFAFFVIPFTIKYFKIAPFKMSLLKGIFSFYIIELFYGLFIPISKIFQSSYHGFESVGVFSIALVFGQIAGIFGSSFSSVAIPEFKEAYEKKEYDKIKTIYQTLTRLNVLFILPIVVFSIMNSSVLLDFLGDDYSNGVLIFTFIILSQSIGSFTGPNGTLLNITGLQKLETINGLIKLTTSIICALLVGRRFVWGVAISILISEIIVNIIKIFQVKKSFNFYPMNYTTILILVVFTVIFVFVFEISTFEVNLVSVILNGLLIGVMIITGLFTFKDNRMKMLKILGIGRSEK
jgi:O-antigen/teichoic acid export membrane protein